MPFQGLLVSGERRLPLAALLVNKPQIVVRPGIGWVESQRLPISLLGFRQTIQRVIGVTQMIPGYSLIQVGPMPVQGLLIEGNRLFMPARLGSNEAQVVVRPGIGRIEPVGPPISRLSLGQASLVAMNIAQTIPGQGKGGVEFGGLLVGVECFLAAIQR